MPSILQKRFLALLIVLATAMLLCSCAKQPPMAPMATVFHVVEAPDGRLNADNIASAANVQVQYASMAINDTLAVTWHGSPEHGASIQTVHQIAPLNFLIPKAWITENLNRSVNLTYTYKVGGQGNVIRSSPITVAVTGQQQAQVFRVVEAPNGTLNVDTLTGPATVEITNSAIHAGDTVGIKAVGVTTYNSPYPTVGGSGPLHYPLANDFVRANIGRSITLTYTYKVGGVGNLITSAPIVVAVTSSPVTNVFRVLEAPNGSLNADTLTGPATVEITNSAIHAGDTVGIKAVGVTTYNSPYPTVGGPGPLRYPLANDFVRANIGRSITLTYTYKVGGVGNLITSPPISIQVTGASDEGARVAMALNERYATTATVCPDGRAAFYCSGVIVRTVDASDSFHAWNPSPGSVTLGGVSFSYMKVGIGMNYLQGNRTQGLILKPAGDFANAGGYPLTVLCSFAYDANSAGRSANGCGASSSFPTESGPCVTLGITTLATWWNHFNAYPPTTTNRYRHQCSFGTDAPSFALSLAARSSPDAENAAWRQNELVIRTWPQNTSNLPIEAFFYFITSTRATGLAGAQFIQRDFKTQTGRSIPVIKVTPNATNGQIFTYSAADQGI